MTAKTTTESGAELVDEKVTAILTDQKRVRIPDGRQEAGTAKFGIQTEYGTEDETRKDYTRNEYLHIMSNTEQSQELLNERQQTNFDRTGESI